MISTRNTRKGSAVLIVVAVLALFGGGFVGSKYLSRTAGDRASTPIAKVDAAQAAADAHAAEAKAKLDAETKKQLGTAQGASVATGVAIGAAQATTAAGRLPVRELETAASLNSTANQALEQVNGPLDPKELQDLKRMVENLNSEIVATRKQGEKALDTLNTALQASVERERAIQAKADQRAEQDQKKIDAAQEKATAWALERDATAAKWDNLVLKLWIVGGAFVFIWLLSTFGPVLSTFFPVLKLPSTMAGKLLAWGHTRVAETATDLNTDLVSLVDSSKQFIAKTDPAKVQAFKDHVESWWEKDKKATDQVEAIKTKLRL